MFFREIWNAMGAGIVWIGEVGLVLERETGWEKMSGEVVFTCMEQTRPLPPQPPLPPPPLTYILSCALWRRQRQKSVLEREGKVCIYSFMGTWSGKVGVLPLWLCHSVSHLRFCLEVGFRILIVLRTDTDYGITRLEIRFVFGMMKLWFLNLKAISEGKFIVNFIWIIPQVRYLNLK